MQDVPLFEGIVQDLFPSEKDSITTMDPALEVAIQKTLEDNNLQVGQSISYRLFLSIILIYILVGQLVNQFINCLVT